MRSYSGLTKRALLTAICHKLDVVHELLVQQGIEEGKIEMNLDDMKASFERLKTDVATKETVDESAKTLLAGLAAQVREAIGNATDLAEMKASMEALADHVEADSASMSAAVEENTV